MVKFTSESNRTEMEVEPVIQTVGSIVPRSFPKFPLRMV